jgi:pimeloyl-ACP methyl ester carboxylesterase
MDQSSRLEDKFIDLGAVTLHYVEGPPSGPPLLFLHGGSARWQSFQPILPAFVADWHVYALDLRGHGQSGRVSQGYRLQDYADDLVRFLETCVRQPAVLVAHSLSGPISVLATIDSPAAVRALVLGEAPLDRHSWRVRQQAGTDMLMAWRDLAGGQTTIAAIIDRLKDTRVEVAGQTRTMRAVYGEDAPIFEWLATNLYHNDPAMLTALIEDFEAVVAGYDLNTLLPQIGCPVLLLQADPSLGDAMMIDTDVERAMTLLAKPTHVRLTGVGHPLHHLHPAPVLAAIQRFLAAL